MATRKPEPVALDSLPDFAALRAIAGDAMMQEALVLLRERLALTPEKLMAMMMRQIAPNELLTVPEECALRGVTAKPLKAMKDAKVIPQILSGCQ